MDKSMDTITWIIRIWYDLMRIVIGTKDMVDAWGSDLNFVTVVVSQTAWGNSSGNDRQLEPAPADRLGVRASGKWSWWRLRIRNHSNRSFSIKALESSNQ
jgi:hypothetical protein